MAALIAIRSSPLALRWAATFGLTASVGCVGAPKVLPPRTPPAAVAPPVTLPATHPKPNRGRVVIYTTDGPMRVVAEAPQQFQADSQSADQPRSGELCISPCVVDVPPGRYRLYLSSVQGDANQGDVDDMQVSPGLTYYLRAPGRFEHPHWVPWGGVLIGIAGALVATAGITWAASSSNGGSATPGFILLGAGVGILIGGGVYTYDAQRGSIQQGATTQWSAPLP